ncbi:MAG: hypothetical protein NT091_00670, partial [Candidatus Falkowbacteria bacterium]|nr:hypothetical protein [Candidatus Falkowbacteria bacterium]
MAKTDASTLSTQDIIVVNPVSLSSLLEEQQAKLYSFDSGVTDSPPTSELIAVESTYDFSFVERRLGSVANGTTETEQSDAEKVTWDTQHSETEPVSQPIVINADLVTQPITAVVDVQQPDVAVTQDFYYWDSNFWNSPIGSTERIYAIKRMVDQAKTFSEFETVLYKQEVQGNFIDRSFII